MRKMFKFVIFLLICCFGDILCIKDIPHVNAKVCKAVADKKSMILDQQELRRKKRAGNIDLFIGRIIECFINPNYVDLNDFGYIGAYNCYQTVVRNQYGSSQYNRHRVKNFIGVFNFEDVLELLKILTKKNILTKFPRKFRQFVNKGPVGPINPGPYFKLSNKLQ